MKKEPIEGWIIVGGNGDQMDCHVLMKSKSDAEYNLSQPHPDASRKLIRMVQVIEPDADRDTK